MKEIMIVDNSNPSLYNLIQEHIRGYVRAAEFQYQAEEGTYTYYINTPYELVIGNIAPLDNNLYILSTSFTVPQNQLYISLGWYCGKDFGGNSFLQLKKNSVVKDQIPARIVYRQRYPNHTFFNLDHIIAFYRHERIEVEIISNIPDLNMVFPLLVCIHPIGDYTPNAIMSKAKKKNIKYPHVCFKCGRKILYHHALDKAKQQRFSVQTFDLIWKSPDVEFYCCSCYRNMMLERKAEED